jgi:hypothetical protein
VRNLLFRWFSCEQQIPHQQTTRVRDDKSDFFRSLLKALNSASRGAKFKIIVVIIESAQMDIAANHFAAQYEPNGVNSSADLHLKGALQKRSCESALESLS